MLVITIELWPGGLELGKTHLGTARITNTGEGDVSTGHYDVWLSKFGKPNVAWKKGEVRDFSRIARGPWDLLYLALKDTVGVRND